MQIQGELSYVIHLRNIFKKRSTLSAKSGEELAAFLRHALWPFPILYVSFSDFKKVPPHFLFAAFWEHLTSNRSCSLRPVEISPDDLCSWNRLVAFAQLYRLNPKSFVSKIEAMVAQYAKGAK